MPESTPPSPPDISWEPPAAHEIQVPEHLLKAAMKTYRKGFKAGWKAGFETATSLYFATPPKPAGGKPMARSGKKVRRSKRSRGR
jgi:hypothetical protein